MFIKLNPAGQKLAAEWVDDGTPEGQTWIALSQGEQVPPAKVWQAWQEETTSWLRIYNHHLGKNLEQLQDVLQDIQDLRRFGEVLFAQVGMPAILRRVAAVIQIQGTSPEEAPGARVYSNTHLLDRGGGSSPRPRSGPLSASCLAAPSRR